MLCDLKIEKKKLKLELKTITIDNPFIYIVNISIPVLYIPIHNLILTYYTRMSNSK